MKINNILSCAVLVGLSLPLHHADASGGMEKENFSTSQEMYIPQENNRHTMLRGAAQKLFIEFKNILK